MITYATEEVSVKELLELSIIYHNAIAELADVFDVSPTPAQQARAFQILSDLGEDLKMGALASVVLAEVKKES